MNKTSKIFCIGLGKLGLVFSQVIAEKVGNTLGYDVNKKILKSIKKNEKSIEPNLNKLINKNKKKFNIVKSITEGVEFSSASFLVLPTPSKKNNEFDNSYLENALKEIGPNLKNKKKYLINITSTINPGSCEYFIKMLESKYNVKHGKNFILTYNPHLIALGSIYQDILFSDLVLIGSNNELGFKLLKNIYKKFYPNNMSKLKMLNLKEAEISKIAINSYITMKISYTNLLSQISDETKNIDTSKILSAIGDDKRIGKKYLSLGAMYSGPCFPRDNLNFISYLKKKKVNHSLLKSTDEVNNIQVKRYIKIFNKELKIFKKKPIIGICGLSYKENTLVNTKSPALEIYKKLSKKFKVIFHDTNIPDDFYKKNFYKNSKTFFDKSNIIFVCYKNNKFQKLGKYKAKQKKVIIDIWNFIETNKKNIIIRKIGISK
jgi:UDPglucose 6-dehydrogenase